MLIFCLLCFLCSFPGLEMDNAAARNDCGGLRRSVAPSLSMMCFQVDLHRFLRNKQPLYDHRDQLEVDVKQDHLPYTQRGGDPSTGQPVQIACYGRRSTKKHTRLLLRR